jgi:hypothetical protein
MLQGPGDEPGLEGAQDARPGLVKAEMDQDFLEVTRPGLGPLPVLGEASWGDTELLGEMTDGGRGCGMEPGRHEAQIAKGTDLQREAEAVVRAPLSSDQELIAFGEREIPDQLLGRDLGGEPPEPLPLGVIQEAAGHPCAFRPGNGRGWSCRSGASGRCRR